MGTVVPDDGASDFLAAGRSGAEVARQPLDARSAQRRARALNRRSAASVLRPSIRSCVAEPKTELQRGIAVRTPCCETIVAEASCSELRSQDIRG